MFEQYILSTPTTINTKVNSNMLLFVLGSVWLWLAEAFTATHMPGDTANHTFLSHLYLYLINVEC